MRSASCRISASLVLLSLLSGALFAQSPVPRRDTEHVSAILTISGGISLGSYEAGVNWALLELFKLTERDSLRRAWNLPHYELKAMAGASAGNINGFLAAIEWCRTRDPVPPEQSLFWKIWVRTGYDQLFPLERYSQPDSTRALFSRRYFQRVLFDTVRAAMRDLPAATALEGCDIPVGVTITRLTPGEVPISRDINAATQRYAATVQVRRDGATLTFRAPALEILRDRGLGALLLLPDCRDTIAAHDVFSLIEASSAFPGAFAPVELRHQQIPGSGCAPATLDSALFSDGGVFDNSPIDLAAGIYDDAVWKRPDRPDPDALLVFIDPEALRGRLADVERQRKREPPATGGISALLELFAGAVPAARQYEMQAFGRLLARAPQVFRRDNIAVTNRRFVVVGQQLGAFAAFLGQPFREYDFTVGVYDALSFIAGESCRTARGVDSVCVAGRLRTLVAAPQLDLGASPFPREMLAALYRREHGDSIPKPVSRTDSSPASRNERLRAVLLRALLRSHLALDAAPPFDNDACRGDAVARVLCLDGFRDMLGRVAADSAVQPLLASPARRPECAPERWLDSPVRCELTESVQALLRDPEGYMAGQAGLMLHQMWRVEYARKRAGEPAYSSIAALSEAVYQSSIGYRYRHGLDLNTSSIPRGSGATWFGAIVPNYVSVSLLNSAFEVGYRPTFHLTRSLAVGLTAVPIHETGNPARQIDRLHWVIGPTVHWKRAASVLSGLETGLEYFGNWRTRRERTVWAVPVTAYLLGDKLRLGFRLLPGNTSAIHGGKRFALTFGLADLNGLVYWMLRGS